MIAYHGTNRKSAIGIMGSGFNPGTYFAFDKAVAYGYCVGGPFIFTVEFSDDPSMWHGEVENCEDKYKQFHIRDSLSVGAIVESPGLS